MTLARNSRVMNVFFRYHSSKKWRARIVHAIACEKIDESTAMLPFETLAMWSVPDLQAQRMHRDLSCSRNGWLMHSIRGRTFSIDFTLCRLKGLKGFWTDGLVSRVQGCKLLALLRFDEVTVYSPAIVRWDGQFPACFVCNKRCSMLYDLYMSNWL